MRLSCKVLNVAADPVLGDLRRQVLESSGFEVVTALNIIEVVEACESHHFDAVVLGHGIPETEKRRIKQTVRAHCARGTPVVALYNVSEKEADDADAAVPGHEPHKLLRGVEQTAQTQPQLAPGEQSVLAVVAHDCDGIRI